MAESRVSVRAKVAHTIAWARSEDVLIVAFGGPNEKEILEGGAAWCGEVHGRLGLRASERPGAACCVCHACFGVALHPSLPCTLLSEPAMIELSLR